MMKEFLDKIKREKEDLKSKNKQLEESLADMNRFYSSEIHNLKTRFEASIVQKVVCLPSFNLDLICHL